jgi:predicted transcriptional regulator
VAACSRSASTCPEKKARAAEALYKEGQLSANEIAHNLGISKATLHNYLWCGLGRLP